MAIELRPDERTARGLWMAAQFNGALPDAVVESIAAEADGVIQAYAAWQCVLAGEFAVRWDAESGKCLVAEVDSPAEVARRRAAILKAMNWSPPK